MKLDWGMKRKNTVQKAVDFQKTSQLVQQSLAQIPSGQSLDEIREAFHNYEIRGNYNVQLGISGKKLRQ